MRAQLIVAALLSTMCRETMPFSSETPRNPQQGLIADEKLSVTTRRGFIWAASTAATATALLTLPSVASAENDQPDGVTLFTNPSGLKYIELREGTGPSPAYGQLCTIDYTAYVKLPNKEKQKFDSNTFLLKHGNGRTVAGLDEGLHTLKEGGIRRLILPPKLGYVDSGLGPLPAAPWNRWRLNKLLDEMVAARNGNVIFDVELKSVIDDEADQGYYTDGSMKPEDFETLRTNLQEQAAKAAAGANPAIEGLAPSPQA